MGDPRQHQLALATGLFDVFGHLVEGAVHLGHLARCVADRQTYAAALTQLSGGVHQTLQRLVELADENPRRGGGQQADGEEPAKHVPDFLAAQWMRVQRHFQPAIAQARCTHPQRRRRVHAQAHFGIGAQLRLHLPLINFTVRPVLFALRHTGADHPDQRRGIGDLRAVFFIGRPIGTQRQGDAVAVLAIHQHVLVHQQINQGQRLGKQHDDEHQPKGAGEKTLGEPDGGFHR